MPSSFRQFATFSPNAISGGIAGSPSRFLCAFSNPTLPGSALIAFNAISNASGNTVTGVSDTNSAYTPLDIITNAGVVSAGSFYRPNAAVLPAGFVGTATGGSATTLTDVQGWTPNQWVGVTLTNVSQGFTSVVTSNTPTTLTFGVSPVSNPGDLYALGGYVQTIISGADNFPGMVICEIAGVTAAPLAGHSALINSISATGVNNLSSGAVASGSSPVMAVGFCFNDNRATAPYAPLTGTTAPSNLAAMWNWNLSQPNARLQYQNVANPGTFASQFSSQSAPNEYVAFMVALTDAVITGPTPGPMPRTIFIMP